MPWKFNPNDTNGNSLEIFPIPAQDPAKVFDSTVAAQPKPLMPLPTTSIDQVMKNAQAQAQQQSDRLSEFGLRDVRVGSYVKEQK